MDKLPTLDLPIGTKVALPDGQRIRVSGYRYYSRDGKMAAQYECITLTSPLRQMSLPTHEVEEAHAGEVAHD